MKVISSRECFSSKIFRVTEDLAVDPDGFEIRRAIVRHNGSAVMLAADSRKRVLLIRQYRLPAQKMMWELPAGRIDPGESPLQTAKRELIEETGYRARKWKRLLTFYPSPGFLSEKMTLFLASDLETGEAKPMEDERIESRWFTRKELGEMVRSGKIMDAKTLVGCLLWTRPGTLAPR